MRMRLHLAAALLLFVAPVAHAEDVVFDDIRIELTGERLDAVLKGLAAANTATAGRAALGAQQRAAMAEAAVLREQHGKEIAADRAARDAVARCRDDAFGAAVQGHENELARRAQADAAFRQELDILAMQTARAQSQGDSAETMKLQARRRDMAAPTHAESLAVLARCGVMPAAGPLAARAEALDLAAQKAALQARALDAQALPAALAAAETA